MDALDLDHSYCARCETYIWPEKKQMQVQVAAKPTPKTRADETVTKTRTVISLDSAPLYCSEKCRQLDLESGSANGRRIMEHFESSCSPSPISPSDRSQHNMDYFTRIAGGSLPWTRRPSTTSTRSTTSMSSMELLEEHRQWSRSLLAESAERLSRSESRAAISTTTLPKPKSRPERKPLDEPTPVPFTHRRWKDSKRSETLSRSIDVDVAALYDQYPMSQRVRSTSSIGSSVRRGSMTASTASDTASICTTSSRGSTRGTLSAEATRGLLVPAVMIRQDSDERSTHSSDDEPEYFVRRNRTITQHTSKRRDQPHKTIQELVRDAAGPDFAARARPTEEHTGPLYEVTLTPPGPTRRHVIHAVSVDGKEELRIVQEDRWEEPQKLFHFNV